MNYPKQAIL